MSKHIVLLEMLKEFLQEKWKRCRTEIWDIMNEERATEMVTMWVNILHFYF